MRYPDSYHKGLPYLDGFVAIYAPKQAVQLDAIRADRAAAEFRGYPLSEIDDEAVRRRTGAPSPDLGDRPLGQR